MKASYGGREYRLVARTVLSVEEEGETYYWQEFDLLAEDGSCLYLEHDEGNWKLITPFEPRQPLRPDQVAALSPGGTAFFEGKPLTVTKRGTGTVREVTGKPVHGARPGEIRPYVEFGAGNDLFSVESGEDGVDHYQLRHIDYRNVLSAFGLHEEIARLDSLEHKRGSQKLFAGVCLVLALLAFVGWMISGASGRVVSRESVPATQVGADGARFGPFTLDPKNRVHRLIVHGAMSQTSAWVAGVLERADGAELIDAQGDLWDEVGYDEDGRWHESKLRSHRDFIITQPGSYYVRLMVEREGTGIPHSVGYELREGMIYPTYLAIYGFVALGLSLLFFVLGSQSALAKMAESRS